MYPRRIDRVNDAVRYGSSAYRARIRIRYGYDTTYWIFRRIHASEVFANVTALKLSSANLGGQLGDSLQNFGSIIEIDLSNNHIGGNVPILLPPTVRNVSLSNNQLTGSIPGGLASLSQLMELSLDNNHITGDIPDAFQLLSTLARSYGVFTGSVNFFVFQFFVWVMMNISRCRDLLSNNLTGPLGPSFGNLSSLTTLYLQNNHLTGTLDVLQDLPLQDLNIKNNLFSGPIPAKLLTIPDFRKERNPFNTTILPSPPAPAPVASSIASAPSYGTGVENPANGPSSLPVVISHRTGKSLTTRPLFWISVGGVILVLLLILCGLVRCFKAMHDNKKTKQSKTDMRSTESSSQMKDHRIDMTDTDEEFLPPPPPPFFLAKKTTVNPVGPPTTNRLKSLNPSSAKVFTIASLQQYTNSFSEENFIGAGMLGSVYKAKLPDLKLLAVKKLDNATCRQQSDEEFLELVTTISEIIHANIVELVGYCAEHDQRLLVYKYCRNGTLYEALHTDDELHQRLSWNVRIRVALGAARALD